MKDITSIYLNGRIYTVDSKFTVAQAMVIRGGHIVYAGNNETARKFVEAEPTEIIDLKGKTVVPGLMDAHLHLGWLGHTLLEINALGKTKAWILEEVRKSAANAPKGKWIIGRCWNNVIWENEAFPTKEELDAVAPDNPVCLHRICCHCIWVNSAALTRAGIDRNTPDCQGGEILRDAQGEPTGILTDLARKAIEDAIPPYTDDDMAKAMLEAQKKLLSYGICGIMEADSKMQDIRVMKNLLETEKMKLRLYVFAEGGETARYFYHNGMEIGAYNDHFTLRGVKFFADGSLSSRGAYLLEDYADRPGHRGTPCYTDEELYEAVKEARMYGFQVAVHGNADGSSGQILNTYARVLDEFPMEDHRYRVEHFQIIKPEFINIAAKYRIIPSMQSVQCATDRFMAQERLGKDSDRLARSYAWRNCLDAGLHIANGTDAPCDELNPFYNYYVAVTRCNRQGEPKGGWFPEQCMTREEALRSLTIWVAESQFEETLKGSLEAGKLADFTVLDRDIVECEAGMIPDTKVLMTVIGGVREYQAV